MIADNKNQPGLTKSASDALSASKNEVLIGLLQSRGRVNKWTTHRRLVILDVHRGDLYCYDQACLKSFRKKQELEYAQGGDNMSVSSVLFESLFEGQLKKGSPTFMESSVIHELQSPKVHLLASQEWQFQDIKDDDLHFKVVFNLTNSTRQYAIDAEIAESYHPSPAQDISAHHENGHLEGVRESGEYGSLEKPAIRGSSSNSSTYSSQIIFKCDSASVKGIWLEAAAQCGRCKVTELSGSKIWGVVTKASRLARKKRKKTLIANETRRHLSLMKKNENSLLVEDFYEKFHEDEMNLRRSKMNTGKPIRVMPEHRYKHVYMTKNEIYLEMLRDSEFYADLRAGAQPGAIGSIQVEVLQCLNLPKLDTLSLTDAVCYMACGRHAFSSDIIDDTLNPVWPRKAKRAVIFPLYHAFAQLFVGIFDDDGKDEHDDFAGRVVVDIARLRPGTMYDVTIPLRESSFIYTKKSRGAIRLRFKVDFDSQRAAIMSYIPGKTDMKKLMKSDLVTTIKCGDKKAFRNIALTVHGKHLPGRYSSQIQRAILREFKMYRLLFLYLAKKTVADIVTWENPFISLYIFLGYMVCIKLNSMASIPPFLVSIFLLFMTRNYGSEILNSMNTWGFDPVYVDELWGALLFGSCSSDKIQPLSASPNDDLTPKGKIESGKKLPLFTRLFILLGFLDIKDMQGKSRTNLDGMEFPLSFGESYPKKMLSDLVSGEYEVEDEFKQEEDEKSQGSDADAANETTALVNKDDEKKTEDTIKTRVPTQDIDTAMKSSIPLSYDLLLVKAKMQRNFKHIFDDRVCFIKIENDVNKTRQMEYVLESEIGIHDYPNPITAKLADHISPVLGMLKMFLGFCRGLTNILTWKDPYAAFWICVFNIGLFFFFVIFPWRIFFFFVGFAALGPQNYFFKDTIKKKLLSLVKKAKFKAWKKKTNKKEKGLLLRNNSSTFSAENNQQIFRNHLVDFDPTDAEKDALVREVAVPYTRLRQNRFYDWPPDPIASKAAPGPTEAILKEAPVP